MSRFNSGFMHKSLKVSVGFWLGCGFVVFMVGLVLFSNKAKAITEITDTLDTYLPTSCTWGSETSSTNTYNVNLTSGVLSNNIGNTNLAISCNDSGGFAIYAVGYSSDTEGSTSMISSLGSSYNIATGTNTTGNSSWAMKVVPASGFTSKNDFDNYHVIPSTYTRVLEKSSGGADNVTVGTASYQIYPSSSQPAGTYIGKVQYTLVYPSTEECPEGYSLEGGICVKDPCNGAPKMQDITSSYISSMTTNTQVQMCDARDGKTYWVAKLADDKVWMTQNLDLVLSTSTALTPSDSNVSANWTPNNNTQTYQYKESGGTTHSDAIWNSDYNTKAHSYRPASDPAAGTSGKYGSDSDTYYSPAYITNGTTMASYKTEAECIAGGNTPSDCQHWSVGTLYSWYAATAGTGNASVSTGGQNVTDSICPKGWHLPSSTSSGEFQALVTAASLTSSNITASPYYFLRAGRYNGDYGAVSSTGYGGSYWSRTSYSNTSLAYYLLFNSSYVYPSTNYNRYLGMGVRCIAGS